MRSTVDDAAARLNDALSRAEAWSPFLRGQIRRFPELADMLAAGNLDGALASSAFQPVAPGDVPRALRLARGRLALVLAVGDLAGLIDLESVMSRLSAFADAALDAAIAAAVERATPGEEPRGIAAIALGKHGGGELNYSSDIDPIFVFDPASLPRRARDEPVEAAVRLVGHVLETLQRRDGEGYVFRVDLRLRPNAEVTPVALPLDAAIGYYESSALAWERAAFIRARPAAGDVALGRDFLEAIRPFIWRRTLNFGAIGELRAMSGRIRDHHVSGQAFGPGFDLKRGRGGIREVEFFAQMHQLIHGGREPGLRLSATLAALAALSEAGRIGRDEERLLSAAYRALRTIEHRLQMIDDRQTHSLPGHEDELDAVAALHGCGDGQALLAGLAPHVTAVARLYDGLGRDERSGLPSDAKAVTAVFEERGWQQAERATERVARWRGGAIRALRTPAALEALENVLPQLIEAFANSPDPDAAILRFDALIEKLPTAINLFRLLEARPQLLAVLSDVLSHAPTLADALSRRASLLDRLIDASAFALPGTVDEIATQLRSGERATVESRLDCVRQIVGELRFALGVQVVSGAGDPLEVARAYSRIAEAAIAAVTEAVTHEFETAHGRVPESDFVIVALGRLGGGELTHASDLDLIYLFTGDFAAESDGPKPLGAVLYYNRLAQRVTAGLSVPTASGALYEIDTRLRPSGAQGPLVVSLDAFERYQRESAWTWEHMALCRARVVYGSAEARRATSAVIRAQLQRARDPETIRADATRMRLDMAAHKPPTGPLDVKLSPGGLVDLEFAVHVTQLVHATGFDPDLAQAIAVLAGRELAPASIGEAHALLTRTLVATRLMAPDCNEPDRATQAMIARACGHSDWDGLLAAVARVRQEVTRFWARAREG